MRARTVRTISESRCVGVRRCDSICRTTRFRQTGVRRFDDRRRCHSISLGDSRLQARRARAADVRGGEVRAAGWGGLAVVARITGLARSTIGRGEEDLDAAPLAKGRVRREGGGRKAVSENDPELVPELRRLVEPATLGDPMRATDMGVEEPWPSWLRRCSEGPPRSAPTPCQGVAEARLLTPVQSQGGRRLEASRPQRAVRAHQREGGRGPGAGAAGDLGRHEEEGVGRQLQERRHRLSAQGRSAAREGARLRGQGARQGRALRRLRRWRPTPGWVSLGITSDTAEFAVDVDPHVARRDGTRSAIRKRAS